MSKPFDNYKYLHKEYEVNGRSVHSISKEWDGHDGNKVYPNTIRRCIKKHGITLRTKSAAQKNFLSKNEHPLKGRVRTEDERKKISEGIQKYWDALSPEEVAAIKEALSERGKDKWDSLSAEEKKNVIHEMHIASRLRSGKGSKNEEKVADILRDAGYKVIARTKDFSPRRQFEIDMAIPKESVAIEWDGIAHFEPIYGDEALKKNIEKDNRKNRALIKHGWTVIRCRDHSTAHSLAFCTRAANKIIELIDNCEKGKVHYIDAE